MTFILFTLLTIQLCYYLFFYYYFNRESLFDKSYLSGISIIICAKNEAENLKKNLPEIARQDYPHFEIIVVDDDSGDNTQNVLEQLKNEIPFLKVIKINKGEKIGEGKKYIISKAVEITKNEVLVFTDADCFPVSRHWLKIMISYLKNYDIVLGIAPLVTQKNNITAWLQYYETAQTALQYIALAKSGNPYMSVGRNMMLRKESYFKNTWTQEELELASGDDDLLIQKIATTGNTNTCTDCNTFVFSPAKENYTQWTQQKIRHFSTGFLYQPKYKFGLGLFLSSKILLYIFAIYNHNYFLMLFYILFIQTIYFLIERKYKIKTEWQKIFLLDFVLVVNSLTLGMINQLKIQNKWK